MAYQLFNDSDHFSTGGDEFKRFWHYYGDIENWKNKESDYATNCWKKKAEFRFFEKVSVDNIAAVLWPIWLDSVIGEDDKYSKTYEDVKLYSRELTGIKFITYDLDLRNPEICFIEASYIALEYFLKTNSFPDNIQIAKESLGI
jgi:hypothetical protein